MKKVNLFVLVVLFVTLLAGCTSVLPVSYSEQPLGAKTGESSGSLILGMIHLGDASIDAAARNGGITTITSQDLALTVITPLYIKYTTKITGY